MQDRELSLRQEVGRYAQRLAPHFSACQRCLMPWLFVDGHDTDYKEGTGCFPLCQKCWRELTPKGRLPFYRKMFDWWHTLGEPVAEAEWKLIETAVLEGK